MEIFRLLGSIFVDNEKANKAIDDTDRKGKGLGGTFDGMIGTVTKWGAAAAAAAGTAAVAIGVTATKAAVTFEKGMANVATLLDGDVSEKIKNLGGSVKQLQKDTGTSADLLTDGLYQVVSAFGDTADSMSILETATKGAKAGNAAVADSVNLLSAVTKGYGDTSAEAANKASDLAFLTVKLGQTTFPELAASMGKVIPLAATMKVGQEELFGAMATLTGVTGNTAEVTTQLRGAIQGFLQPTTDMAAALKKLGYENGQVALESEGLGGILNSLKEVVGGNEVAFASLFGSVEAKNAVLALTGTQAENFAEKTRAMGEAAGATEAAFEKQQATVSGMMDTVREYANVLLVNLGEKLLPKLTEFLGWVIDYMPQIETIFETVFDAIGTGISWVTEWIGKLIGWIREWKNDNSAQLDELWQKFQDFFAEIIYLISGFIELAIEFWNKYGDDITATWQATWDLISAILGTALDIISDIFHIFGAIFKGDWAEVWNGVKALLSDTWEGIKDIIKAGVNFVLQQLNRMIRGLNQIKISIPDWVPGDLGGKEWGIDLPLIPLLAAGGEIRRRGAAIVGDAGPELLELPEGARVTPLSRGLQPGVVFDRGAFEGAIIMDDYGVDRLMDRVIDRLAVQGVKA